MREGRWQTSLGVDLAGKTLGVVGLDLGSRIAAFGDFLGMRVLATGIMLTAERAARGARGHWSTSTPSCATATW